MSKKRVYLFTEGSKDDKMLLGGKGANLCEMTKLGLPVPFGFTISTPTCTEYFENNHKFPAGLKEEYLEALKAVEAKMGMKFGDPSNPLLFSVRSGAPVSMPGMMDTILNLGMNDEIAEGLANKTNNPRFAYDAYRRFISMFNDVVMDVHHDHFEDKLVAYRDSKGYKLDTEMTADDWKALVQQYKEISKAPEDPYEQLDLAIQAVFKSWWTDRAGIYRRMNSIPDTLGTAVNVQAMVFGNFGEDSGSGVAFTRDPSNGENYFYGEYLPNAAGEDVVAGIRTPLKIEELKTNNPAVYNELYEMQDRLEKHYKDMQDLEFTIQQNKLYLLQTRNGKRTGAAAIKIACDMVREGMIDEKTALMRINPEHLDFFLHPTIDPKAPRKVVAKGLAASPGGATGEVVFTAESAEEEVKKGKKVILVRRETTPEDIGGMKAAEGILTSLGGMTSHAAVVARGMGTCAICGCGDVKIDYAKEQFSLGDGTIVKKGDVITLDGTAGEVMLGAMPMVEASESEDFKTVLSWADKYRTLKVRANAETPEDARKARELGCQGIGLCRTEHMFFDPARIDIVRSMILAENKADRQVHIDKLFHFQKEDMKILFEVMEGLPVTIRLLDPPLHEFLPQTEKDMKDLAGRINEPYEKIHQRTEELHEINPMLGFRGCRLSIIMPELTTMQAKAIIAAAVEVKKAGGNPKPEIMIPLVVSEKEITIIKKNMIASMEAVIQESGVKVDYKLGTMIETPRAALTAGDIAKNVQFMSFGTNDLTQMTFGFSRDDVGKFMDDYLKQQIVPLDPFVSLDQVGVGRLIKIATEEAKAANENLHFGICGEHGGEARSVDFCYRYGFDYVSCSPFRVPIARVAAAQAVVRKMM